MDKHEIGQPEPAFRKALASLDHIGVPPLQQLRRLHEAPRHASGSVLLALALGAVTLIVAMVAGEQLATWRSLRAGAPSVAASASATPFSTAGAPARDPKEQTPPPRYTAPPSPRRFPAGTPSEVLGGLAADTFPSPLAPGSAYGQPLFVRALRPTDRSEWLVPIVTAGQVSGVVVVVIYEDSLGSAGIQTGWSGRFPHPLTPEEASAKASSSSDPAQSVELVWATVDPRQGGPATEFLPFYVVTLRSGARWYVFNSGSAVPATQVDIVR